MSTELSHNSYRSGSMPTNALTSLPKNRLLSIGLAIAFSLTLFQTTQQTTNGQIAAGQACGPVQTFVPQQTRYTYYRKYIQEPQQVTKYRTETETQHGQVQVTEYQDETTTETRYRKITKFVPTVETDYRTRQIKKLVPETRTVMQTRHRQVTEMVEETGFREQQVVVPRTIQETTMQDRSRIVQTPVTQTFQRQVPVTTYQQQTTYRPQLVNNPTVVNQLVAQTNQYDRSRLRWLGATNYTDPLSGRQVYRRRGLYWTRNNPVNQAYVVPTVVPNYQVQQVPQTTLVPTTSYQTQSYDVNTTVNRVVTEKVPVTVNRTVNELVNQKIPYTVRKPVTRTITEQVPVQQTTMREEITEERTPVQRTVMKRVEEQQPYNVQITKKVPITKMVDRPRVVTRRVPYTETQMVTRLAYFRVTLDSFGRPIVGTDIEVDIYGNPVPARTTSTVIGPGTTTNPISSSQPILQPTPQSQQSPSGLGQVETSKVVAEGSTLKPQDTSKFTPAPRLRSLRPDFSGADSLLNNNLLDLKPIEPSAKASPETEKKEGRIGT